MGTACSRAAAPENADEAAPTTIKVTLTEAALSKVQKSEQAAAPAAQRPPASPPRADTPAIDAGESPRGTEEESYYEVSVPASRQSGFTPGALRAIEVQAAPARLRQRPRTATKKERVMSAVVKHDRLLSTSCGPMRSGHGTIMTREAARSERKRQTEPRLTEESAELDQSAAVSRAESGGEAAGGAARRAQDDAVRHGGPNDMELEEFCGWWHPIKIEGREEMLKAMKLPWILRKIVATMPLPDTYFFRHADGFLHSHTVMFGKVVDECYQEGGTSSKSKFGVTTTLTYHWVDAPEWEGVPPGERPRTPAITYVLVKDGNSEEETKSGRWVLPDGETMVSETWFRRNTKDEWTMLRRTYERMVGRENSDSVIF